MPQVSNYSWMNMIFFSFLIYFLVLIMIFYFFPVCTKLNPFFSNSFKFFFLV